MGVGHLMLFHHCFQLRWESPFYLLLHFFCLCSAYNIPNNLLVWFSSPPAPVLFRRHFLLFAERFRRGREPSLWNAILVTDCLVPLTRASFRVILIHLIHPLDFHLQRLLLCFQIRLHIYKLHANGSNFMKTADFIPCITVFKFPFSSILKTENQGLMWWPMLIILAFSGLKHEDC